MSRGKGFLIRGKSFKGCVNARAFIAGISGPPRLIPVVPVHCLSGFNNANASGLIQFYVKAFKLFSVYVAERQYFESGEHGRQFVRKNVVNA